MRVLALLFLMPILVLAKAPNEADNKWSNEDDFTLAPKDISTVEPTSLSKSTVENADLSSPSELTSTISPAEIILPYILRKLEEEGLINEVDGNETDSKEKLPSFPKNNIAEEPKTYMTPPPPLKISSTEKNDKMERKKSAEDSPSVEDVSNESTSAQPTTEEITSDSVEDESTDPEVDDTTVNQPKMEFKDTMPMKEYASKFQNYKPMDDFSNEQSKRVDDKEMPKLFDENLKEPSVNEDSQEDQSVEMTTPIPETEDQITEDPKQSQVKPEGEEETPSSNDSMDHVILDKPEVTLEESNPELDTYVNQKPKNYFFLRPRPIIGNDESSSVGTDYEPSMMSQMQPPKPYNMRMNAWNMYPQTQQQSQPMYETVMDPMVHEHNGFVQRPNLPLMSAVDRDADSYQIQPTMQIRNMIPMMQMQPQFPRQNYYNFQSMPQMTSPQMYSGLGFSGDYFRSPYWSRPFPFYRNSYPSAYRYDNNNYNYVPNSGYYKMNAPRYIF